MLMQGKDESEHYWTSSPETIETMKFNRKLMKQIVTISNEHLEDFIVDIICLKLL